MSYSCVPKPARDTMPRGYYVYKHVSASGVVFYVGKGKGWRGWHISGRSAEWVSVATGGYHVEMANDGMSDCCSITLEKVLIDAYGVSNLTNKSTGGEGSSGAVRSDASKVRYSLSKMGNASRTGMKHTEEAKRKIGDKHRGKVVSQETRRRMSVAFSCKDVLTFVHDDGTVFSGIRSDFIRKYNMHKGAVYGLVKGKSKVAKGWRLA